MDYLFIGIGVMFGLIGLGFLYGIIGDIIDLEGVVKAWQGNQKQITYVFDLDSLSTKRLKQLKDEIEERLDSRLSSSSR